MKHLALIPCALACYFMSFLDWSKSYWSWLGYHPNFWATCAVVLLALCWYLGEGYNPWEK